MRMLQHGKEGEQAVQCRKTKGMPRRGVSVVWLVCLFSKGWNLIYIDEREARFVACKGI